MKKRSPSNGVSGCQMKGQIALAGLLLITLLVGIAGAAWCSWRAPLRYVAVLEGEDHGGRYFTTLAVASSNRWQARRVALGAANRQGLRIMRVEEIEAAGSAPPSGPPRVLKAPWDKTYYLPDEH